MRWLQCNINVLIYPPLAMCRSEISDIVRGGWLTPPESDLHDKHTECNRPLRVGASDLVPVMERPALVIELFSRAPTHWALVMSAP
jgi:hypothetical protein